MFIPSQSSTFFLPLRPQNERIMIKTNRRKNTKTGYTRRRIVKERNAQLEASFHASALSEALQAARLDSLCQSQNVLNSWDIARTCQQYDLGYAIHAHFFIHGTFDQVEYKKSWYSFLPCNRKTTNWRAVATDGVKCRQLIWNEIDLSFCLYSGCVRRRPVYGIHTFSTLFFIFFFFFIYWRVSCSRNCVGELFDASSNRIFYPPFVEERKNPSTMSWGRSIYWLFFPTLGVTFFCFIPSGFVSGYAIEIGRKAIILIAVLSVGGPSSSERRGKCGRAGTMQGKLSARWCGYTTTTGRRVTPMKHAASCG